MMQLKKLKALKIRYTQNKEKQKKKKHNENLDFSSLEDK